MGNLRISYLVLGILFSVMTGFVVFVGIMAKSTPAPMAYMTLAMAVMSFCLAYLYPQFKQKDERMKLIREKGMFASFVAMIFYLIVFNIGLQFEFFVFSAAQLINIITALLICTVFISFVIYSKIY
ncbi:permease [Bacillus sp. HNG]|uniref:permease n=1 Tax=Bacillus sp. HNG TaxID=2293325 RepID=UPI000E2F2357|nr:permease [Bacillus sp. HNG]RFB15358.1 permease [Bacillus sp. HNG]